MPVFVPERKRNVRGERRLASLLDAADQVFGKLGYHGATTNIIAAEAKVSPATLYQFFPNKEAIADALETRYAMDLAKEVLAADVQELASVHLEEAIRRVTGVVIEFHRKHPAFLAKIFVDHLSEVLRAGNPKLDKQDALWSAEVVLTALRGFLPGLAGRKTPTRSRTIDSLNQMLVRYLESALRRPQR